GAWVLLLDARDKSIVFAKLENGRRGANFLSWEESDKPNSSWYIVLESISHRAAFSHWCRVEIPQPPKE
ncbi:MAG: hypothetical protein WC822_06505, partial [Candidatus Paceibacterota bacterium]